MPDCSAQVHAYTACKPGQWQLKTMLPVQRSLEDSVRK